MATVIVGTRHIVWFQSLLPCSSARISLRHGIGRPALIVVQIFWLTTHRGEWLRSNHCGCVLFSVHRLSETARCLTFARPGIIRSVDDGVNESRSPD